MANIYGLYGYNKSSGTNKLFAVYGNDIVDVDAGTGYSQNLTPGNNGEFATYVDNCFFVNGVDATRAFNGTSWSSIAYRARCPIARYVIQFRNKLYLAYVTINGTAYPSRVVYSGLPYNNDVRWEYEYGTLLAQTASSSVITDVNANFKTAGIKQGDVVFISTGANAGEYYVSSVDSETQITLTEELDNTVASSTYWISSNWFDVKSDNNDYIRGVGTNSDRLLIFKLNSIYRYNESSLFQIGNYPGTSSHRSIVNIDAYTYYFNGSESTRTGVYIYDGTGIIKVSSAIQPYIDGIASTIYTSAVGWREGEWYRCYVGDITNAQRGISVSKAVISHNSITNKWSVDPINKVPYCAGEYLESDQLKVFFGDDSGEVFQTPSGYSYDGSQIPWAMETGIHYPASSESINKFLKVQIISRDARGVAVRYKLIDEPSDIDDTWTPLGDITADKTEFIIPREHRWASGINIRLEETGIRENTHYIERISVMYQQDTLEML
jgi:hypothetical protein